MTFSSIFGRFALSVLLLGAPSSASAQAQAQVQKDDPNAALFPDFVARVKAYDDLRDKLDNDTPRITETKDPAKIQAAMNALAAKIRAARGAAKPGDIFTLETRKGFRARLTPALKGPTGAKTRDTILDEAPNVPLVINAEYPKEQPLATAPVLVLEKLPQLPEGLEYRFIGKHMILRDSKANLIVDFIYNVIP